MPLGWQGVRSAQPAPAHPLSPDGAGLASERLLKPGGVVGGGMCSQPWQVCGIADATANGGACIVGIRRPPTLAAPPGAHGKHVGTTSAAPGPAASPCVSAPGIALGTPPQCPRIALAAARQTWRNMAAETHSGPAHDASGNRGRLWAGRRQGSARPPCVVPLPLCPPLPLCRPLPICRPLPLSLCPALARPLARCGGTAHVSAMRHRRTVLLGTRRAPTGKGHGGTTASVAASRRT